MSQSAVKKQSFYTQTGLWYLFVMCAFPLHLWTILLVFQDVGWVTERTNSWDAVGVASYGLLFALVESILLFLVFSAIGFILPRYWKTKKRVSFIMLLVMILSIWGMIGQLLFIWNINLPWSVIHFLANSGHPLRLLYILALSIVIPTVSTPVYIFLKSEDAIARVKNIADQLSLLTGLYLLFDVIGIIIVIIRNL